MKDCNTCHISKPLDQFYPHRAKCRRCYCDQTNAHYQAAKTSYRKARREYMRAFRRDPAEMLKVKARNTVTAALQAGRLTRELCFCGQFGEAHHPDYSQPLLVKWLCKQHHTELHHA